MTTGLSKLGHRIFSTWARSGATVRVTDDPADLKAIRQLRYKVYIEEQKKPLPWADHAACELPDPLDASGIHFIGTSNRGDVLAAARLHMDPLAIATTLGRMGLDAAAAELRLPFGYFSKLVVQRSLRGAGMAATAISAVYNHGRRNGGLYCLCHCNPKLVSYYESIGMYQIGSAFHDPFVGPQVPMMVVVEDSATFEQRRSFLAADAAQYPNDQARASGIVRHFQSLVAAPVVHHAAA